MYFQKHNQEYLINSFAYWTSENKRIDDFIQKTRLKIRNYDDIVFEWVPYNQFNEIKETGKNGLATVYSAIWKDGPLCYNNQYSNYARESNKEVALKSFHNSRNSIGFLINEAEKYSTKNGAFLVLYGISQNPDTNDYILETQFKKNEYDNAALEWIPYNQFDEVKEMGKNDLITAYSAIWKDGPLYYNNQYNNYTRDSNKKVALKCLNNSQNSIDFLINEAKKYSSYEAFLALYGISQNPITNDYILVQNNSMNLVNWNNPIGFLINEAKKYLTKYEAFLILDSPNKEVTLKYLHNLQESINFLIIEAKKYLAKYGAGHVLYGISQNPDTKDYILALTWTSGNEKIDDFIQEMQLKMDVYKDTDGPLYYNNWDYKYTRYSNKEIALKCLHKLQDPHNSQDPIDILINEAKKYLIKFGVDHVLYGISQNPNSEDYILVYNWTSGNEKIDDFIQEIQLQKNRYNNTVFEWIPYIRFNEIKKTGKNGYITIFSAIWKNDPLNYDNSQSNEYHISWRNNYSRNPSNKEVALKCLHNSQISIDILINEAKKYLTKYEMDIMLYGISQNPDTVYSAIWKGGPLCYNNQYSNYARDPNKEVALKCLHNSQESIDFLINETKKYSTKYGPFLILYGISQNPDTEDYILVLNWTSGNERIDDFIQEIQLETNKNNNTALKWIPYNQFNKVKEIGKNSLMTIYSSTWNGDPLCNNNQYSNYVRDSNKEVTLKCLHNSQESIDLLIMHSAIWKDGPLCYDNNHSNYTRNSNKKITLKYLLCKQNSLNPVDFLINEAKKYSTEHKASLILYGISQNPDTNNYILVQNSLANWISGNEKIDDFIQHNSYIRDSLNEEVTLKCFHNSQKPIDFLINETKKYSTEYKAFLVLYGISQDPYTNNYILNSAESLINEVKKYSTIEYKGFLVLYGISQNPDTNDYVLNKKYVRNVNKTVTLKCLQNLQESIIDILISESRKYSTEYKANLVLYGISQNPNTKDYILVLNWTSGNEKIDNFIQGMQLKKNKHGRNGLMPVYSAIWKDGPSYWNEQKKKYGSDVNKAVTLKYLQKSIDILIDEAEKYLTKYETGLILYGISQNPNTEDYILVLTWTSGNEKIDGFIQKVALKCLYNSQNPIYFLINEAKKYSTKHGADLVLYGISQNPDTDAIWRDGPLCYNDQYDNYIRDSNKEVALKCLHNSQNHIDFLIDEAKKCLTKYLTKYEADFVLYGISQNPDTEDYILVLNWTSGNDIIDDFIIDMRLKINYSNDIIFEWILYDQFNVIKEIGKGGFSTVYSAKWKNGPLEYDTNKKLRKRNPDRIIALKFLHNSQNITNKFLNEAKGYSIARRSNIINIYGISQNPITKDYIFVLEYAKDGNFNEWMNENYEYFIWQNKLSALLNIINGLKEIHQKQKQMVHRDFHTGNILFLSSIDDFSNCISISDMGLYGEVDNVDEEKIYGVMPYVAPEVLRGKHYTQAADIYSFGIIMYFVATGKQPFYNRAHDGLLALDICKGVRPEIDIPEAPKCYIDLMKKCWDSNPSNRPSIIEISELISSFHKSYGGDMFMVENEEIEMQFNEAEEYRKKNLSSIKNYQAVTHPQAIYISRSLNSFTKDLPKNNDCETECLDCKI
ncbi:kinase-like domain-containing protein [Rhizophagus clarus]|uniref:Kinase-like domain-containing protein n=1 Tax=Rhizophagus clarus TaxID=94130 RepID=A0A8H3QNM6_9GLOM|nr:kinase-like domain-containing protein [Rhizophagus clarus]